ncbi:MAG: hypothetical protein ACI4GD_13695 [Lachnospiraceae bacterium]
MKSKIMDLFKQKRFIELGLFILFVTQLLTNIYFNLALMENHMGYDSSWSYLKAALIWSEKSLNSGAWLDQTSVFFDSSMSLAVLIYGITKNLLLSYGLANIIVLILILICVTGILKLLGWGMKSILFALNLVVCPYLTNGFSVVNDLGYFNNMISGPAFYSLRVLIVLIIIREFLVIRKKGKIDVAGMLACLLCLLAGASSGIFIIIMILLPYIIYEFEIAFLNNDIKFLLKKEAVYAYICTAFVCAGKFLAKHFLGIVAIDTSRTWTTLEKLPDNLSAPILGLMKLIGVLPVTDTSVSVLSAEGIYRVFPIFIFFVLIVSIGVAIKCMVKNYSAEYGFIHFSINAVAVNILVFGLFNAQYGTPIFEERYIISTYMILILLVSYYIDKLDLKQLFSKFIILFLFISLIANNYISDKKYVETSNDSWQLSEIRSVVSSQDAKLVYFWGDDVIVCARAMRAYDLNHVYKAIENSGVYHHWGDYTYFEDNADYNGSSLLIIPKGTEIVPENILSQYKWLCDLERVSIFRCDFNAIDRVNGITGEVSIDFPTTPGIVVQNGVFEGNSFITDGTGGYVMRGPNSCTITGNYDFIIDYQIIEGENAIFDVAIDGGAMQLGETELDSSNTQKVIENISLEQNHLLEYRIQCEEGTKIKIDKVTIVKK